MSDSASIADDIDYLQRNGVEPSSISIANRIVRVVADYEEDDYYASKYGHRMIDALIRIERDKALKEGRQ